MFKVDSSKCSKIRKSLVYAYQVRPGLIFLLNCSQLHPVVTNTNIKEQRNDLSVVFKCKNGQQLCSETVLEYTSDFFSDQLAARKRQNNKLEFNYEYSIQCLKNFLDIMHGIDIELTDLTSLLELIKFLKFENKGLLNQLSNFK